MRRIVPPLILILGLLSTLGAAPAAAGGWAASTLDSIPEPRAGETVDVGFTIRQHGVAPVDPDGTVGITITPAGGPPSFFAAERAGEVGHYVARITFPDAGPATWSIQQGWFMDHDLGPIEIDPPPVGAATAPVVSESRYHWPAAARFGLPLAALGLVALAVVDLMGGRRRARRPTPAS